MTIIPAAGPLMVISELLKSVATTDPMMAVKIPASGGNPLASEMPKHKGSAIKKTNSPDTTSDLKYCTNPAALPIGKDCGSNFAFELFILMFVTLKGGLKREVNSMEVELRMIGLKL